MIDDKGITLVEYRHVVEQGETLGSIAAKYHVTWQDIAACNQIDNPNVVSAGYSLVIPGLMTYVVEEGDTISSIATRCGVSCKDIFERNFIDDPSMIQTGDILFIP